MDPATLVLAVVVMAGIFAYLAMNTEEDAMPLRLFNYLGAYVTLLLVPYLSADAVATGSINADLFKWFAYGYSVLLVFVFIYLIIWFRAAYLAEKERELQDRS